MKNKINRKKLREQYESRAQLGGIYSITCLATGKKLFKKTLDLRGSRNHFEFSRMTGSCIDPQMADLWAEHGPSAFAFEIVEQLEKKKEQTEKEFAEDIEALEKLWLDQACGNEKKLSEG